MEIFTYEGKKLNIIKKDDDIWFRAKIVANILKYTNTRKAIRDHVDLEDKNYIKRPQILGERIVPPKK